MKDPLDTNTVDPFPGSLVRTVRTEGSYDTDRASTDTGLSCRDPSRTRQDQKEESDINTIVRLFGVTGQLPLNLRLPQYGDFDAVDDYQTALHAVKRAEESFLGIPAEIRATFNHDPGAFAEFCLDPGNLPQLREWGLAPTPTPPPTPPAAS